MSFRSPAGARARALVSAVALSLATLALCGCANLVSWLPAPAPASPGAAATPVSAAASAAAVERADYEIEVDAPSELRGLLTNYLDLSRFQTAPAAEGITSVELERLVLASPAQARALLETEGYFNADVKIERSTAASGKPLLRVRVAPGPRAVVDEFTLDTAGDLAAAVKSGDAAAIAEIANLRRTWLLQPGQVFRQPAWNEAKAATLTRLRAEGYAAASWQGTSAQVDAARHTVRIAVVIDSGPLFHIGAIDIQGLNRYDADGVRRLAAFQPGMPYNEKLLLDFQERLQKIGLFEGASVEIDPNPATAEAAPVHVRLKELPLQQATLGVGYSANTGPRLSVEHTHRQVFGTRWIAKNKFELGPDLKSWDGELTSHPLDGLYRNLISGSAERLRSTDELRNSWSARTGRTQDTPRIERLYYAEVAHSRVDTSSLITSGDAVSGNYNWVFRDLDSVLLPTRGVTLSAQAGLGYAKGQQTIQALFGSETDAKGPFTRAYGRITWYRPLGSSWYGTLRVEGGEVFTRQAIGVPDTLLFRAGGDDSVRGYGYRSLGPMVNGTVISGRVLVTSSAEVAHPISPRYPAFWWAAFVDAGNAADRWSDLNPVLGYGLGLRWRSPVGPLRVDLAYGQEVHQIRAHLSVGIAF